MTKAAFSIGDRVRVPARNTHGADPTDDGEVIAVYGNGDYDVSSPDYVHDDGTCYMQTVFGEDLERLSSGSAEMAAALDADIKKLDVLRHADRRERIATAALQGLCANPQAGSDVALMRAAGETRSAQTMIASVALSMADALIAELDKPVKP